MTSVAVQTILDDLPESFWTSSVWVDKGEWVSGRLDVADRHRIILAVLMHPLVSGTDPHQFDGQREAHDGR